MIKLSMNKTLFSDTVQFDCTRWTVHLLQRYTRMDCTSWQNDWGTCAFLKYLNTCVWRRFAEHYIKLHCFQDKEVHYNRGWLLKLVTAALVSELGNQTFLFSLKVEQIRNDVLAKKWKNTFLMVDIFHSNSIFVNL